MAINEIKVTIDVCVSVCVYCKFVYACVRRRACLCVSPVKKCNLPVEENCDKASVRLQKKKKRFPSRKLRQFQNKAQKNKSFAQHTQLQVQQTLRVRFPRSGSELGLAQQRNQNRLEQQRSVYTYYVYVLYMVQVKHSEIQTL